MDWVEKKNGREWKISFLTCNGSNNMRNWIIEFQFSATWRWHVWKFMNESPLSLASSCDGTDRWVPSPLTYKFLGTSTEICLMYKKVKNKVDNKNIKKNIAYCLSSLRLLSPVCRPRRFQQFSVSPSLMFPEPTKFIIGDFFVKFPVLYFCLEIPIIWRHSLRAFDFYCTHD